MTTAAQQPDPARPSAPARLIAALLRPVVAVPAIAVVVSLIELAVADRKYGVFTGGFGQSNTVDTAGEIALLCLGFGMTQLLLVLLAWRGIAWLNRRSPGWPAGFHFSFGYGGVSLAALSAQYQLHSYFSDAVSFTLLKQLGGGSLKDALLFGKNEIALGLAALAGFALVWWVAWRLARKRLPRGQAETSGGVSWRWIGTTGLACLVLLAAVPRLSGDAALGLGRMLAWQTLQSLGAAASDFDGDGYGLFGLRTDPHPFDPARHPLALDVPGNGVDEDGYGGDLTLVPVPHAQPETLIAGRRPHVILVVMESTRGDVLGKVLDGKPVAPNLDAVAAAGSAAPSYSHVGFTTASLKSIFSGRLAPHAGDPSLFTELRKSGYRISVFSGQPEDFGDISETVGMRANAATFVDAEVLRDKRAFSFAAQGSLLIDEGVLLEEFDRRLGKREDWQKPQFVYLNFQSPHFPYDHPGVPQRFAHPPIARADISEARRADVEKTYWNAVAHADDSLGQLIARLKQLGVWEDTVMLVTGDHGESLFEDGFLGHGHIVNQRQFGTFMAVNRKVAGLTGPLVISDYRAIVLGLLGAPVPAQGTFAPFMYIGELDTPSVIGLAGTEFGIVSLNLDQGRACFERPVACRSYESLSGRERSAVDGLVARWGSERWVSGRR